MYIQKEHTNISRDLEPFLILSSCRLRRICFEGSPNADSTAQILHQYSSITELTILMAAPDGEEEAELEWNTTLVTHLKMLTHGSAGVSPQLSKICFGCQQSINIDYPLYLKMLDLRWNAEECALKASELLKYSGPDPRR